MVQAPLPSVCGGTSGAVTIAALRICTVNAKSEPLGTPKTSDKRLVGLAPPSFPVGGGGYKQGGIIYMVFSYYRGLATYSAKVWMVQRGG